MYVTVHRVRSKDAQVGLHGFYHEHGSIKWPSDVGHWPEENPGILKRSDTEFQVGGHRVLSYLDALSPDASDTKCIERALDIFQTDLSTHQNPTIMRIDDVTIRFGIDPTLLDNRLSEYTELASKLREMLNRD